jgi:hypothetical protein
MIVAGGKCFANPRGSVLRDRTALFENSVDALRAIHIFVVNVLLCACDNVESGDGSWHWFCRLSAGGLSMVSKRQGNAAKSRYVRDFLKDVSLHCCPAFDRYIAMDVICHQTSGPLSKGGSRALAQGCILSFKGPESEVRPSQRCEAD